MSVLIEKNTGARYDLDSMMLHTKLVDIPKGNYDLYGTVHIKTSHIIRANGSKIIFHGNLGFQVHNFEPFPLEISDMVLVHSDNQDGEIRVINLEDSVLTDEPYLTDSTKEQST